MTDIGQLLARRDMVARRYQNRANLSMGIYSIPIAGLDDDVVASQRPEVYDPVSVECPGILEKYSAVSDNMNWIPLWPAILRLDNKPGCRRENRFAPTEAILQFDSEYKII
jgi:hypothetical protein